MNLFYLVPPFCSCDLANDLIFARVSVGTELLFPPGIWSRQRKHNFLYFMVFIIEGWQRTEHNDAAAVAKFCLI